MAEPRAAAGVDAWRRRRVAVTGASGLIGGALAAALRRDGHTIVTIGRDARADVRWNPGANRFDAAVLVGVDAVLHFAGATIGTRWTRTRKREILDSRVRGTQLVAGAMARLADGPRVLICASAIGYYGSHGDEWLDETSVRGSGFLADVVAEWEAAAEVARAAGVRVVHLRQGLVLSPSGGALAKMLPAFRLGAGGRLGNGHQWMSWIALDDLEEIVRFILDRPEISGPVNAVAANPVTNTVFTEALARAVRRPAVIPVPAFVLRTLFGEMADEMLLASQRVRPARLESAGFRFRYQSLDEALHHEMGR